MILDKSNFQYVNINKWKEDTTTKVTNKKGLQSCAVTHACSQSHKTVTLFEGHTLQDLRCSKSMLQSTLVPEFLKRHKN